MRTELREGEKLVLEVKKHWVAILDSVLLVVVAVGFMTGTFIYPEIERLGGLALAAVVAASIYFLCKFYDRETNIWAVTDLRVIDEWGVFTRNTKDSPLDRIHNVSYKQPLLGLLLGYGDVSIQTAAEEGATVNKYVDNPKGLKDAVMECQDKLTRMRISEEVKKLGGTSPETTTGGNTLTAVNKKEDEEVSG